MTLLLRLGIGTLASAALIAGWLAVSTGAAHADGGLLGGVLSADEPSSEGEDDAGLLDSSLEVVGEAGGAVTGTLDAATGGGAESQTWQSTTGGGAADESAAAKKPVAEPGEKNTGLVSTVASVAAKDDAPTKGIVETLTGAAKSETPKAAGDQDSAPALQETLAGSKQAVSGVTETLGEAGEGDTTDSAASPDAERAGELLTPVASLVEGTVDETSNVESEPLEPVLSATAGVAKTATEPLEPVLSVTAEVATTATETLEPVLSAAADVATTAVEPLEPVLSAAADVATTAVEPLEPVLSAAADLTTTTVEPLELIVDSVTSTLSPTLGATTGLVDAAAETIQPLITTAGEAIEPIIEPAVVLVNDVSDPVVGLVQDLASPVVEPLVEQTLTAVVGPIVEPVAGLLQPAEPLVQNSQDVEIVTSPAAAASELANQGASEEAPLDPFLVADPESEPGSTGLIRQVLPARIQAGPGAEASFEAAAAVQAAPEQATSTKDVSRRVSGDRPGPTAWLSALAQSVADGGGLTSIGTVSAVLTALLSLFIAPAIAARAFVAVLTPRSPCYLPVYPPD